MSKCTHCAEDNPIVQTTHSKILWGCGSFGDSTKEGHIVVLPRRHVSKISDLSIDELSDLIKSSYNGLRAVYASWFNDSSWGKAGVNDKGSGNLGFNYGPESHDPISGDCNHLAFHVVSRNPNDTNFMWWTTRSSIMHLKDSPMKISFEKYFKILQGSTNEREFSDVFSNIPNFNFTEPILENCPLCKETEEIHQNETARVLFSVKPYKFGHVMVIPKGHVALLDSFSPSELTNIAKLIDDSCQALNLALGTSSFNIGINHGPHSGASIPSHLHIHVVPRKSFDGNSNYWSDTETKFGSLHKPVIVRDAFQKLFRKN